MFRKDHTKSVSLNSSRPAEEVLEVLAKPSMERQVTYSFFCPILVNIKIN